MTTITRPCPHCHRPYDISHRMHNDRVWCPCGGWSAVVMRLDGGMYLSKCEAPDGTEPVRETTADAALVAEMSVLRAELEAVKAREHELREALEQVLKMRSIRGARRVANDALEAIKK